MSDIQLTTGDPVPEDHSHTEINPETGQQRGYVVLSPEERSKAFIKPYRTSYLHRCGVETTMGRSIAETYARNPRFFTGTFCVGCRAHFPLSEFTWEPDGEPMDPDLQDEWNANVAKRREKARVEYLKLRIEALERELRERREELSVKEKT